MKRKSYQKGAQDVEGNEIWDGKLCATMLRCIIAKFI